MKQGPSAAGERALPKTLVEFFAAKHPGKVEEGWSEQDWSGGREKAWNHWVYLSAGWCYPEPGAHIIHEGSVKEVKAAFKRVAPCACECCQNLLKNDGAFQ